MTRQNVGTAIVCLILALAVVSSCLRYADARLSRPDPPPTPVVVTLPPLSTPTRAVVATLAPVPTEALPRPEKRVPSPSPTSVPALVLPEPTLTPKPAATMVQKGLAP